MRTLARRAPTAAVVIALFAISLALWWDVWSHLGAASAVTCNCGDPAEQTWWFGWLPFALRHGLNPFHSMYLFATNGGISALSNTSWFTLGALFSPVTLLVGPVATSNVVNLFAPVASGVTLWWLLRRFSGSRLINGVLAVTATITPYFLNNVNLGHVNLTLMAYIPGVLLITWRALRGEITPRRAGIVIGVATIGEFFLGLEVLAIAAVAMGLGGLWYLVEYRPRRQSLEWRRLGVTMRWAAYIAIPVLAIPIFLYFCGPQHVAGPFWTPDSVNPHSIIHPNLFARLRSPSLAATGYVGARGAGTAYVGWPLVWVAIVSSVFTLRTRRGRLGIVFMVGGLLLALCPGPLWGTIPLLSGATQVRFIYLVWLGLAFTVSAAVTRVTWSRASLAGSAIVLLAALPTFSYYDVPLRVTTATVPSFFSTHWASSAGTLVVFPFPWSVNDGAMAWQAESGFHFKLAGGFGFIPVDAAQHDEFVAHIEGTTRTIVKLQRSPVKFAHSAAGAAQLRRLRSDLIAAGATSVVIIPSRTNRAEAAIIGGLLGPATAQGSDFIFWQLTPSR